MSGSSSKCCKTHNDNGHSFLTHSFLLKGEEPPMCIGCDKRLTIEHILLTCLDFVEIRELHHCACCLKGP